MLLPLAQAAIKMPQRISDIFHAMKNRTLIGLIGLIGADFELQGLHIRTGIFDVLILFL